MSTHFLCQLKNRKLIQVSGEASFKFLQNLTTNDLNKIINEKDFIINKSLPKNILFNKIEDGKYQISNSNIKHKKLITGLPSLFLSNNGKILFDCIIYNIKYIYDQNIFPIFYIDCNANSLTTLLNILEKRKLSCDVDFKEINNIAVYQLLPCISLLSQKICYNNISNSNKQNSNNYNDGYEDFINTCNDLLDISNNEGAFFFSKDQRHDLLGYRIYDIIDKETNFINEYIKCNTKKDQTLTSRKEIHTHNNNNIKNTYSFKNEASDLLNKFEKEEKVKLTNELLYDFFKLNLGVIENLYDYYTFFKDGKTINNDDLNLTNNISHNDTNNSKNSKPINSRDMFNFKDLSPFDINYDKQNYISKDKGCYIGQEVINRTRNKLLINKYKLSLCINYSYYDMFMDNQHNLDKHIYKDFPYYKYIQNINNNHLFKSSFFLLQNITQNNKNVINYKHQYDVIIQNNDINSDQANNMITIGYIYFYNNVMGLCFLINKKIEHIKNDLYQQSSKIYMKSRSSDTCHRISLIHF
ncbi:aminomethyltransferase, putative [Plasmodium chabaudi chabaudi]|uniref:Aminomethyltransferase, putative n=1 Tax=Plasmodium chabaudi chabaudi TaxID=31271 RepID=A0A4V0KBZ0_PLACU|nr:aminomethyltransferase, putative [Plasmodium chabaudi chabaudi]VTZ70142.1 aminomethyltransferase, putative [Plasmodium chabaudi chabaudi]|eukprot:XP_733451.2 aminomethyltransferase, putative [Plasmodium chabaudi chabaudi]